ncbi:MAG TPA: succinate dehydrogenase, partial [Opitutus sp.]|nr:succinate dehydrogenase [Opitutus sp.]
MNLFRSTIGRKINMAITGVILIGFVIGHLVGNLQVFSAPDKLNGYAHFLQSLGPLLWVARIGLLVAVGLHVWAATVLTLENHAARDVA